MLCRLNNGQDPIQWNGFIERIKVALERRINRNDIIGPVNLDAMSCKIDGSDVCVARTVSKFSQDASGFANGKVMLEDDKIKTGRCKHSRHRVRVVRRIGECGNFLIGRITNDERYSLLGSSGTDRQAKQAKKA